MILVYEMKYFKTCWRTFVLKKKLFSKSRSISKIVFFLFLLVFIGHIHHLVETLTLYSRNKKILRGHFITSYYSCPITSNDLRALANILRAVILITCSLPTTEWFINASFLWDLHKLSWVMLKYLTL